MVISNVESRSRRKASGYRNAGRPGRSVPEIPTGLGPSSNFAPTRTRVTNSGIFAEKSTLGRADRSLDGGDVLPGFVVRLSELLHHGWRPRRS